MKKQLLVGVVAMSLFVGVAFAHGGEAELPVAGTVPGDFFYFLETISEGFGTLFTFKDEAKIDRALHLAEERLSEADELAQFGDSKHAEKAMERYEKHLKRALAYADRVTEKGEPADDVNARVAEATARHQSVLLGVYEKAPKETRESIEHALQQSVKGHEESRAEISEEWLSDFGTEIDDMLRDVEMMLGDLEVRGIPAPRLHGEDEEEDGKGDMREEEKRTERHERAADGDDADEDMFDDDLSDLEEALDDDFLDGVEDDLDDIGSEL